jgi:hypothetical protein
MLGALHFLGLFQRLKLFHSPSDGFSSLMAEFGGSVSRFCQVHGCAVLISSNHISG